MSLDRMENHPVLRSRIAAAAVGVSVLGVTAALVPTVSNAAGESAPATTKVVTWADKASDFTPIDLSVDRTEIPAGWSWFAGSASTPEPTSLDQVATFDAKGITAKDDSEVALLHPLQSTVTPDAVPALVASASATSGGSTQIALLVADAGTPNVVDNSYSTVDGLHGASTEWDSAEAGEQTTQELADELKANNEVVFGYAVILAGPRTTPQSTGEPTPSDTPADPSTEAPTTAAPTSRVAVPEQQELRQKLFPTQAAQGFARAAVTPAASGIADIAIGDLTTYFTPQPTAAATATATSLTVTQATTTGYTVSGSGFAPGETVTVGFSQGQSGSELPGTLVADADGAVTGTVVLPSGTTAGTYALVLVGSSSAQTASIAITVTADPAVAPVATPVSGRATFTG